MYEREFYDILNSGERILWADRPNRIVHMMRALPMLIFGLLWGTFDLFFILMIRGNGPGLMLVPFFLLHLFPLWLGVGGMLATLVTYQNTIFCYTDKRVIVRSGFWGVDYKSTEFDAIRTIEVNVNPLENSMGLGTIRINEEHVSNGKSTTRLGKRLYGISRPYEVYKDLKKISLDVRSDIYYPNQYRPSENRGYNTEYRD
ncbi:MAG: PH domain-containing protein [Gudongella sp.]|jgi:hypothetical protein|nr:PH domain-containing protein [Gudongella sp.]